MTYRTGMLIGTKYEIIEHIGKGATANVYKAKDLFSQETVALKVSKFNAKVNNNDQRFEQEAKLLIDIKNSYVIQGYEQFEFEGHRVIAMEYVKGESLDVTLKTKGKFTDKEVATLTIQVIRALQELHKKGVMHRDLKPSNLMYDKVNKSLKLMDFGIAQVSEDQGFTKEGNIIGTIGYMAPEVIRGNKANPLSEVYSLGVMAYKMLTGVLPFGKGADLEVARRIVAGGFNPAHLANKSVSPALSNVITKMMALEPKDRYQRLSDIETELEEFLAGNLTVPKQGFKLFKRK